MRRILALLAVVLAGPSLAGCCCERSCSPCPSPCAAPPPVRAAEPAPTPLGTNVPAPVAKAAPAAKAAPYNATCPVMLGNPVNPDITTVWEGKVVGFCSEPCRAKFVKNPEKYAKNLP